jgi:hypothetical protein
VADANLVYPLSQHQQALCRRDFLEELGRVLQSFNFLLKQRCDRFLSVLTFLCHVSLGPQLLNLRMQLRILNLGRQVFLLELSRLRDVLIQQRLNLQL